MLCIGHADVGRFVADVVRGRPSPHDPAAVVAEFSSAAKSYGLNTGTGDNFSAEWPVTAFRSHAITYQRATLAKSAIYLECLPQFNRGSISLPNVPRLLRELRLLERRTHRSGKDTVDHGPSGCDDHANACAAAPGSRCSRSIPTSSDFSAILTNGVQSSVAAPTAGE